MKLKIVGSGGMFLIPNPFVNALSARGQNKTRPV